MWHGQPFGQIAEGTYTEGPFILTIDSFAKVHRGGGQALQAPPVRPFYMSLCA